MSGYFEFKDSFIIPCCVLAGIDGGHFLLLGKYCTLVIEFMCATREEPVVWPSNCPNWRYRSPNLVWNMAPFSTLTFYLFIFPPVSLYIHFMHERENCYGLSQVVYFFHYLYLFFFSYCSRMVKLPCIWLRLLATPTPLLPWFSTALTSQPKTM